MKPQGTNAIKDYAIFFYRATRMSFRGGTAFYSWMTVLTIFSLLGLRAYCKQLAGGLVTTGMTDQVSWGIYIANFTFLVGIAASALMLVIPEYIYRVTHVANVVIFGELLAISAIVMCHLFVIVDLGRPDRFWHLIPVIGLFNFPVSMLSWDVIVLIGYLVINVHICGYLLYMKYLGRKPNKWLYMPFVFLSIVWAISIHTVTAFVYVGLVGRPFWNAAIVAPRFLCSAFTAGPCLMIIAFQIIRKVSKFNIGDETLRLLWEIATIALLINLFLFGCEVFKEFYSDSLHVSSSRYLFFGIHGNNALVPWIWTALAMEVVAAVIFVLPGREHRFKSLNFACVLSIVGIWIEKGMGLIVPGFLPTPLGEIVEYAPTANETLLCVGIWAFGILIFSWMIHLAVPIVSGEFRKEA